MASRTRTTGARAGGTASGMPAGERRATYAGHICGLLLAAFSLSLVHTVYASVRRSRTRFTVTTPLAWGFYAVAFWMAVLARRTGRGGAGDGAGLPGGLPGDRRLLLPDDVRAEQQTVFGWFENDVFSGCSWRRRTSPCRWRGTVLVPL